MPVSLAIAVPVCLALFGAFATHAFAVRRSEDYRGFWGALIPAFLPAMIAGTYLATDTGVPPILRNVILGTLGGIIGLATAIWLGYAISDVRAARAEPPAQTQGPPPMPNVPPNPNKDIPPSASGNFNLDQKGGTVNQTYINQAQPKLQLTDALKRNLLQNLPKDKEINVQAIGSAPDQQVGIQISEFLKANGYSTSLMMIGMRTPPADRALSWEPASLTLVVAPSVRD